MALQNYVFSANKIKIHFYLDITLIQSQTILSKIVSATQYTVYKNNPFITNKLLQLQLAQKNNTQYLNLLYKPNNQIPINFTMSLLGLQNKQPENTIILITKLVSTYRLSNQLIFKKLNQQRHKNIIFLLLCYKQSNQRQKLPTHKSKQVKCHIWSTQQKQKLIVNIKIQISKFPTKKLLFSCILLKF
eukprot:TRINITY_DN36851_c0_g1_i3.p4 TRINITY_DN36851_c0_g1~~TRINITY_DN36851_c0_g1_i3.p4  ORF type:complete len:188 (+),score=-20.49 TRINITY_DN36851_c0_g1_i3:258-821(+)